MFQGAFGNSNCQDVSTLCSNALSSGQCGTPLNKVVCCKTCQQFSGGTGATGCGRRYESDTFFQPGTTLLSEKNIFENKIFGGQEADKNSWPWMALLGKLENGRLKWLCGGAIINDKWILTAAHCLLENIEIVRLGEHDIEKTDTEFRAQDFRVETAIWYDGYQANYNYHDIALVKISIRGPLASRFRPVCLPWGDEFQSVLVGKEAIVTGWGARTFLGEMSTVLREVTVKVFDQKRCIDAYSRHATDYRRKWPQGMHRESTLCVGHELAEGDSCQGDSGGPLVIADHEKFTILGVVSTGIGCGHKDYPGLYTPVYYKPYLKWIKDVAFTIYSKGCGLRYESDTFFEPGTTLLSERNVFENKTFGKPEAVKNSWPWMALLGKLENGGHKWQCGGALINDKWILTAAHCLLYNIEIVRLGEHDIEKTNGEFRAQDFEVETALSYDGYQSNHNYHDIALVKISIRGPLASRFRPVCLPWRDEFQSGHIGKEVIVTGWGIQQFGGKMSTVLREATIKVFDQKRCIDAYSRLLHYRLKWPQGMHRESTLCAGPEFAEIGSCQGDSGGPLVIADHEKYTILGVVSTGFGCGDKDYPHIYMPVYYKPYLKWIKDVAFK